MNLSTNKTKSASIALFLVFAMAVSLVALPATNAQTTRKTYPYIGALPNPASVGQEVLLHTGITLQLNSAEMGWEGLSVTITRPDGTTETLRDIKTDSTGGTGVIYVPEKAGNYTLQTHFPEQVTTSSKKAPGTPDGTTMLASDSEKLTLVVQEEPLQYYPTVPLPTEYWTRPIDAQLREWYTISGNWLTDLGFMEVRGVKYNDDAPETAHILWTRQVEMGGLVGGETGDVGFETGAAYEPKVPTKIIIDGILFYTKFASRGQPYSGNNEVTAVDLHTGEELWSKPLIGRTGETTGATVPAADRMIDGVSEQFPDGIGQALSHGQLFYWESYNYMGAYGILWTVNGNTWMAFDALNGRWIYTITDVPSGTTIYGPKGEIYRYTVNTAQRWMALWNMSALVSMAGSWNPHGNVYNASGVTSTGALAAGPQRAWVYNITIPEGLPGSARSVVLGDRVFGASVSTTAVKSWAFSLKTGQEGALLYNSTWNAPADWAEGNVTVIFGGVSLEDDVFVVSIKETMQHYGFSATTGQLIWGPTESQHYLDNYAERPVNIIDGRLYSGQVSGIVYCYNVTTGKPLWTYTSEDPYNQVHLGNNFPRRGDGFVVDGKFYSGYAEHSPNQPLPRDAPFFCLDIETGELVWSISMVAASFHLTALIGDSIIALFNTYDNSFYAIGKGPSATSVSASPKVSVQGSSVIIEGSVTDISPGTEDSALTMRFPNGVPAVSDESMSAWMEYVYMQKTRPTNATGVTVNIDVFDANGNYRNIGNATSDANGFYSFTWEPDIPGKYILYASFAGSESYYGSYAETAFNVEDAPAATPEPTPEPQSAADMYFVPAVIGLLVAIIIVGALTILMLRKRA